ncbi:MAG TPA: SpoIID/LytB domain-containing protein [Vicinamibacterales bacterium]|nr:SpoIID/LytB domain-containing protein [Vicinamibacterales bacterium]
MSGPIFRFRPWAAVPAAAALLLVAACQPPQLPESTIARLPASVLVRTAGRIETVPLEDYVLASSLAEVSPVDQPAAAVERIFEVQAVLARTYAAGHIGKHRSEGFDLCDTTHCQLYDPNRLRVSRFAQEARNAVQRTAGLVLTYQGQLAEGLYHADCGGYTASAVDVWGGSVPYLVGAPDDVPSTVHRQWRITVPIEPLRAALNASPRAEVGRSLDRIDVIEQDCGGHVSRVSVVGEHSHELRGEEFRTIVNRALGPKAIQSTLFTVTRNRTDVVFSGAGFGHGVGLCQVGAAERAKRGDSLQSIVTHYYPGVLVSKR